MVLFREQRLIFRNLSDFEDQTRYSSRVADANAAAQSQQHQQQLINNGVSGGTTAGAQAAGQRLIQGAQPQQLTEGQGKYTTATQAGILNQARESGRPGETHYNTQSGVTGQGAIEYSRNNRLVDQNATEDQIAQNQKNLKGIMDPGYGVTSQQRIDTFNIEQGNPLQKKLIEIQGRNDLSVESREQMKQTAIQQYQAEQQQQQQQQQGKEKKEGESAAAGQASQNNPQAAGMEAMLGNLPPEAQAIAPFIQNILSTISEGQEANAANTQALLNGGTIDVNGQQVQVQGINSAYDEMDKKIKDMEAGYTKMSEGIQGMLDKAKEQQDKYLSEQETTAKERLAWNETQMLRVAAKQKQDAVDRKVAEIALRNRAGSDGGLAELEEVRMDYESRIDSIKTEFGVQRTDLAAKFTGLYLEANNSYLTSSIANIKDAAAAMERIAGQSLSNKQARTNAETTVLKGFMDQQVAGRKEYANALKDGAKEIQSIINTERSFKAAEKNEAWEQFKWLKTTFGTNIPPGALADIKTKLPGVDVDSLAKAMTAAEIEKARKATGGGSGGGGGLTFSPSQMTSTGMPSLETFLAQKEKESAKRGDVKFDRKAAEAEYKAKAAAYKQYDPVEIMTRFENKAGPMAKHERAYAEQVLDKHLLTGNFKAASEFVDNTGGEISSTESGLFTQALNARTDVNKLSGKIEQIGMIGPVTGKLRELNPYDGKVVEFNQLIRQTVPNLARGIFREVGVLTDQDVARYEATIGNPELTLEQARTAFRNLKDKIDSSMANQISVWDANGKRVKGFRDLYESQPPEQHQEQQMSSDPVLDAYLKSLR